MVQYGHLLLPGNTDQWEMGADYNRRKNVECLLLYLQWVCDDAVFALKRLLVKGGSSDAGPPGPGGVHAASIEAPPEWLHWPQLRKDVAALLQARMVAQGTRDKTAIVDCITWGDLTMDALFKQVACLLSLPSYVHVLFPQTPLFCPLLPSSPYPPSPLPRNLTVS